MGFKQNTHPSFWRVSSDCIDAEIDAQLGEGEAPYSNYFANKNIL
jgi:hypothetical protein